MKKILLAAVAATALFSASAFAQDTRGYVRGGVGLGVAGDAEFNGAVAGSGQTLPFSSSSDLDVGWQVDGAVGAENVFFPGMRFEAEAIYLNNETDDGADNFDDVFDTGDEGNDVDSGSADIDIYGGFVNALYDFGGFQGPVGANQWRPYIGAGVGYGKVNVEYANAEADDEVFMWQLKTGIGYEINDNLTADLGYRYLNAESADVTDDDINLDVTGEVDVEVHAVTAGMRYKFGGGY